MDYFEISTERLMLKPLGKNCLKSTIQYAMDHENTKYMCHWPDETVEWGGRRNRSASEDSLEYQYELY